MKLAIVFFRRDWLRWGSYRMAVLNQLGGIVVYVLIVAFLSSIVSSAGPLTGLSGGYVSFVISALAFMDLLLTSLFAFPGAVRESQLDGTLESVMLTPIRIPELVFAASLFPLARSLFRLSVFVAAATWMLGLWHYANVVTVFLILVPACLGFAATGLVSASFVLVFKVGDPLISAYTTASWVLGGTLLPLSVFPNFVQTIGQALPVTHALHGIRIGLGGAPPQAALGDMAALWVVALLVMPLALTAFGMALKYAKRVGSLVQY